MGRAETGQRGEAAAARFYQKQGAELLGHNYHTRMGEIDLILREPDGTLVFCEVKTRAKDALDGTYYKGCFLGKKLDARRKNRWEKAENGLGPLPQNEAE